MCFCCCSGSLFLPSDSSSLAMWDSHHSLSTRSPFSTSRRPRQIRRSRKHTAKCLESTILIKTRTLLVRYLQCFCFSPHISQFTPIFFCLGYHQSFLLDQRTRKIYYFRTKPPATSPGIVTVSIYALKAVTLLPKVSCIFLGYFLQMHAFNNDNR